MRNSIGAAVAVVSLFWLCGKASAQNISTQTLVTLSSQGAGTVVSADLPNNFYRGVLAGVNLTTATSASVVVHIQGKDPVSATYYDILDSQALTTTGFTDLEVYPGLLSTSTTFPFALPTTWRIEVVVTGASASVTGTIDASLIQ